MTIFTLFFFYNSKTSAVWKILILDLEFASKNTSNEKKKLFMVIFEWSGVNYLINYERR